MSTPEGRVKREVKKIFARMAAEGAAVHYFMPVQTGYGKRGLDFHVVVNGFALFIETKEPNKLGELTPTQREFAVQVWKSGAAVFVVSNDEGLRAVHRWMDRAALTEYPLR